MCVGIRTTNSMSLPSADFLVMADFGVSGSIRPVLIFFSSGMSTSIHMGSPAHPPLMVVKPCIYDLLGQSKSIITKRYRYIHYRISDEQGKDTTYEQYQGPNIGDATTVPDITLPLLVVGIRVMQLVVLFDIVRVDDQVSVREDGELLGDGLGGDAVLVVTAACPRRDARVVKGAGVRVSAVPVAGMPARGI